MSTIRDNSTAIVVLPAVGRCESLESSLRRWLARADIGRLAGPRELLARILAELGFPYPGSGLGALRMWGQTGERPTVWVAAADPVYLEPRLDHLAVHALPAESVPTADLRGLVDHLQATLADGGNLGFARLGRYGYLRAQEPIATASVPPGVAHLDMPNEYLPTGPEADTYRRLISEVEMALHDHEVNVRRQERGLQPINGLWIWGGGFAPEPSTVSLPPLFASDPLLTGYWLSHGGVVDAWPGDIAGCAEAATAGFVALTPERNEPGRLDALLQELRELQWAGRLKRLVLMFRDGVEARIERHHRWRFWRRGRGLFR